MLLEVLSYRTTSLLRIKGETLFSPFVVSLLVTLIICFAGSYSRVLMAIVTFQVYMITEWIAVYIFRNLAYDKEFKENNFQKFPYQEHNVGHWFKEKVEIDGLATRTINMLNLRKRPRPNDYPDLDNAVFPPTEQDMQDSTMLYHGTNKFVHAKSLLAGIMLSESEEDGDFSCGKGFYVTKDFENAANYAFVKDSEAAVFCFKIPNEVLEKFRENSLNLMGTGKEDKKRWKDVVKGIGKVRNDYNFIEGPAMKRERGGNKTYRQIPDTHQLCILKEEMAEAFDTHLHSVVFYNTSKSSTRGRKPRRVLH